MKKVLVLSLLLLGWAVFPEVQAQTAKAQTKLTAQDLAGAKEAIDVAINDPKEKEKPKTWFVYGQVYSTLAGNEEAKGLDPEAHKKGLEGYQKAKAMGHKATDLEYYNAFMFAGRMCFMNEDLPNALVAFQEAQKATQNNPVPYMFSLEVANELQDYAAYKTAVETLLTIEDGNYDVEGNKLAEGLPDVILFSKGDYYGYYAFYFRDVEKDYNKALEVVQTGLASYPDNTTLQALLVDLYVKTDKLNEAITNLEAKLQDNPTANDYYNLGTIYDKSGDFEKAKSNYEKALELEPENASALYNLGAMYYNQAATMVKEINNMSIQDYNAKGEQMEAEALKLYGLALPYFEKLYDLNPKTINRAAVLEPLQTLYKNKGDADAFDKVTDELETLRGN